MPAAMAPALRLMVAVAAALCACVWPLQASEAELSPSMTFAALNRDLLVSYATTPGFSHYSPAQDAIFSHPELLRDYDPKSPLPCSSQTFVATFAQPRTTAAVLIAISKCVQDATIANIVTWVGSKLPGAGGGGKVVSLDGSQDVKLAYTFALVDATCSTSASMSSSRLDAFKSLGAVANSFTTATNGDGRSSTTFSVVISFVENAAAHTAVQQFESNAGVPAAFNFALCEGTATVCESAAARAAATSTFPDANYLAQTSLIKDVEVFPPTPRYSCDGVLTSGTPAVIGGGSSNKCICVCPREYALVQNNRAGGIGRCEPISSSSAAPTSVGCAWDSYGTFQYQVTESDALSTVVSAWGLPVPALERSRSTAPDQGQVVVSSARKSDPPIYDALAVSSAVARHSSSSSAVPMTIPSWAKTSAREFGDPIATTAPMPSSNSSSRTLSWRQYEASGSSAVEQALALPGFGVYELQVRATRAESSPYSQSVSCVGCLAVTDHFRPRGATACPSAYCDVETCGEDSVATAYLSASSLYMAREAVAAVATFQLNASNDEYSSSRCDDMQIRTRSFHEASTPAEATTVTDADEFHAKADACFSPDSLWGDLLLPGSATSPVVTLFDDDEVLQQPVPVSGQCTRCCWLGVQLRETWVDYCCDAEFATQRCQGLDSESSQCTLSQCLLVDPAVLFTTSVSIRQDAQQESEAVLTQLSLDAFPFQSVTQIHRVIDCDNLDGSEACSFRVKLSDLVVLDASFAVDLQDELLQVQLPSEDSYGEASTVAPSATDEIVWRFRVASASGSSWRRVNAMEDELAFTQTATTVTFEAWSQCGKAGEQTVSVYLHLAGSSGYGGGTEQPDSALDVCERLENLWYQTSVLQPMVTDTLCNYPGSDFVELTFDLPAKLELPVTAVSCFASFDEEADADSGTTVATQIVSADNIAGGDVVRRFAIELRQSPTTAFLTSLHVSCDVTLAPPQGVLSVHNCARSFVLASCEGPGMAASNCADGEGIQCVLDECAGGDLPGLFEACGGTVVRPSANGSVELLQGDGECCQACGRAVECVTLLHVPAGEQDVRRCELQPPTQTDSDHEGNAYAYAAALPSRGHRAAGVAHLHGRDATATAAVLALAVAGAAIALVGAAATRRRASQEEEDGGYVLLRGR